MGEGEDGICLLHIDPQTTFTLKEFVDVQTRQAQEATEKLTVLRVKVLEIVKEACEVGKSQECEKQYKLSFDKLQVTLQLSLFKGVVPGWWAKAGYRVNKCGLDHCVVFLRKRMRNRLYSPNASLHPGVKMGASELSWKHYEMEGDNLWWTGILSRGV